MKSLKAIQILARIGKILSKTVFVLSVIGAVCCAVVLVLLFFEDSVLEIAGIGLYGLYGLDSDLAGAGVSTLFAPVTEVLFACIGEIILAGFAVNYFKNELEAKTPFTYKGASELLRLGILTATIPVATIVLGKIASGIISVFAGGAIPVEFGVGGSVSLGIMFIVLSLFCRYGAEISEKIKQKNQREIVKSL